MEEMTLLKFCGLCLLKLIFDLLSTNEDNNKKRVHYIMYIYYNITSEVYSNGRR